ncbi:MAG: T9SS type A sorting domain-containing protein [bacterium]
MKKGLFLLSASLLAITGHAQTFNLAVTNGYDGGNYTAGDTVHVWCEAIPEDAVFAQWNGDIATVADVEEWHTTLVMPARNVTLTANFRTIAPFAIQYERIKAVNNRKNVYYYFPPRYKGVIFLAHGTGGKAEYWLDFYENYQFTKDAVADSFAVIFTEAEEITLNTDLNGDGKLRWSSSPLDSAANVDFANIIALTDTFVARGRMARSTPRFAAGISNGAVFSFTMATFLKYNGVAGYCGAGNNTLFRIGVTPAQWCMAKYDSHEEVGPAGNAQALANYNTLASRGIAARYFLLDRSPCYPDRFGRSGVISLPTSRALFNEFRANGVLDANDYFHLNAFSLIARVTSMPAQFPVFISLNETQRLFVFSQVDVMYADHAFYSDYNRKTLRFFNSILRGTTRVESRDEETSRPEDFALSQNFPNPFNPSTVISFQLPVNSHVTLRVFDVNGREVATLVDGNLAAGNHAVTFTPRETTTGLYFYKLTAGKFSQTRKAVLMK